MLIFISNDGKHNIFIHIPKNSGKYIRKKISNDMNNKIVKSYWHIDSGLDLAHIPYIKRNEFITDCLEYNYFAHSRNPYNRIVSAFFYKNPDKKKDDFKYFVTNELMQYDFNMSFNHTIIHYYPQYLFVCDENLNIADNIKIDKLEDIEKPKNYDLAEYFNPECLDIINNIYSNDFLYFNYEKINNLK